MSRDRLLRWSLGAACAASLALSSAAAGVQPKLHECQRPVKTGEEAFELHGVTVKVACAVVLELSSWEYQDDHVEQLYGCRYPHGVGNGVGTPYLKRRSFHGYRLSISRRYGFVMSRGRSWFAVTGTDFPLNCT